MATVFYLCDHNYPCENSLFCSLNGGECDHTPQKQHSRTKIRPKKDIYEDTRFEPVYDNFRKSVDYIEIDLAKNTASIVQDK